MSKVKKIVLEIGKKEISLSVDEAKELKEVLSSIFNEAEVKFVPYPSSPIVIERYNRPYYQWYDYDCQYPKTWCGSQTADTIYLSNNT